MRSVLGVYLVTDEASCAGRSLTDVVMAAVQGQDVFVATAAVSDWRPAALQERKIKKGPGVPPPAVALARPADEEVSTLMRMGFPRAAAERALRRYSRNVELAASYLIDHAPDGWADLMGDATTLPGAPGASPRHGGPSSASGHAFEVVTPRAEGRAFGDDDDAGGPSGERGEGVVDEEALPASWVLPADAVSHNSTGNAADDRLARALGLSGPAVQQGEERRDSLGGRPRRSK